jgi:hypothetical protein
VGCGRGIALRVFAERLTPRALVGVDVDPVLVALAEERVRRGGIAARVIHGDLRALPLQAESFDPRCGLRHLLPRDRRRGGRGRSTTRDRPGAPPRWTVCTRDADRAASGTSGEVFPALAAVGRRPLVRARSGRRALGRPPEAKRRALTDLSLPLLCAVALVVAAAGRLLPFTPIEPMLIGIAAVTRALAAHCRDRGRDRGTDGVKMGAVCGQVSRRRRTPPRPARRGRQGYYAPARLRLTDFVLTGTIGRAARFTVIMVPPNLYL